MRPAEAELHGFPARLATVPGIGLERALSAYQAFDLCHEAGVVRGKQPLIRLNLHLHTTASTSSSKHKHSSRQTARKKVPWRGSSLGGRVGEMGSLRLLSQASTRLLAAVPVRPGALSIKKTRLLAAAKIPSIERF